MGFLRTRHKITQNVDLSPEHYEPGRKVIFFLFDALREDFIEWPEGKPPNLSADAFSGKKLTLFKRLVEEQPLNAFLQPLSSEMPTMTVVRIKTYLSGVLGSVIDFTEALVQGAFTEDNILVTLHKKFKEKTSAVFYGEDIWVKNFGQWFTKEISVKDADIRLLDLNDNLAKENVISELDNGSEF